VRHRRRIRGAAADAASGAEAQAHHLAPGRLLD